MAGGLTVGDIDNDSWLDIFVVGYESNNLLFKNNQDGTFSNVTAAAGVNITNSRATSAAFADFDNDGWQDLFVTTFGAGEPTVFRNLQNGHFENVTAQTGITSDKMSLSMAFGDYDRDDDIDMFVTHWTEMEGSDHTQYLWSNNGDGTFVDATTDAISDENGMGTSVGDYDNDGDLD